MFTVAYRDVGSVANSLDELCQALEAERVLHGQASHDGQAFLDSQTSLDGEPAGADSTDSEPRADPSLVAGRTPATGRKPLSARALAANRRNALLSTGPRTAEGKARSSRNARTHGLWDATPMPDAEQQAFTAYLREVVVEHGLCTDLEILWGIALAQTLWSIRQVEAAVGAEIASGKPYTPRLCANALFGSAQARLTMRVTSLSRQRLRGLNVERLAAMVHDRGLEPWAKTLLQTARAVAADLRAARDAAKEAEAAARAAWEAEAAAWQVQTPAGSAAGPAAWSPPAEPVLPSSTRPSEEVIGTAATQVMEDGKEVGYADGGEAAGTAALPGRRNEAVGDGREALSERSRREESQQQGATLAERSRSGLWKLRGAPLSERSRIDPSLVGRLPGFLDSGISGRTLAGHLIDHRSSKEEPSCPRPGARRATSSFPPARGTSTPVPTRSVLPSATIASLPPS